MSQQINSIELLQTRPLAPPEVVRPQRPLQRQVPLRGRPASKPTVIRGITYYKAKVPEEENNIEEQRELGVGRVGREAPFAPCVSARPLSHTPLLGSDCCRGLSGPAGSWENCLRL